MLFLYRFLLKADIPLSAQNVDSIVEQVSAAQERSQFLKDSSSVKQPPSLGKTGLFPQSSWIVASFQLQS